MNINNMSEYYNTINDFDSSRSFINSKSLLGKSYYGSNYESEMNLKYSSYQYTLLDTLKIIKGKDNLSNNSFKIKSFKERTNYVKT